MRTRHVMADPDARIDLESLLEVRGSSIQGRGVFTRSSISPGVRIIEYVGEIISAEEADRRYDDHRMERHQTYLFSLDDGRCIDGQVGGNVARLINHSCEPNCEAAEIEGHVWIQASRPIDAGEELTYDYAYEWQDGDEAYAGFYACRCGAPRCRGTILAGPS